MVLQNRTHSQLLKTTIVAGLVAGVVMGVIMQLGTSMLSTIGAIVGPPSLIAGWIVHLLFSLSFAGGFVGLLAATPMGEAFQDPIDTALLAMAYGALLAIVTWGFLLPVSLAAGGSFPLGLTPSATGLARLSVVLGIAHLAYGLVLGTIVAMQLQPLPLLRGERLEL